MTIWPAGTILAKVIERHAKFSSSIKILKALDKTVCHFDRLKTNCNKVIH